MSMTRVLPPHLKQSMVDNPVAWWLFGCAGLVTATLTVGAAAKLTRTGASMLYWVPSQHFPPRSDEDWLREYELYGAYMQRHQRVPMSLDAFKQNFMYESLHRRMGQATALAFAGPLAYFYVRERLPRSIHPYVAGVLAMGALQHYVGRRLVHTNVRDAAAKGELTEFSASHGLTYHTAGSMVNLALLLWAGFHLVSPPSRAVKVREMLSSTALREIEPVRRYMQYATALMLGTAAAGTAVASIDAGKQYNTFPKMGKQWIPEGVLSQSPWYRNLWENVATVQLDHRVLAVSTVVAYGVVYTKARKGNVWDHLPSETKKALQWSMVALGGQALGGISTVMKAAPTTLAMLHESGAAVVLGTSLYALYTLRFARPMLSNGMPQQAVKMASKAM